MANVQSAGCGVATSGEECSLYKAGPTYDQGTDIYQRSHFVTATDAKVYVTDRYANKIYTYDHSGIKTGAIELTSPDTPFNQPSGLTPVGDNLFIADIKNNRIVMTDMQGKYISQFGTPGSGDGGEMDSPHDIAWSPKRPGYLYVTDNENKRMLVFRIDGKYQGKFSVGDEDPTTCAFDSEGKLYVTHKTLGEILIHEFDYPSDPLPKRNPTVVYIGDVKPKQLNIGPDDTVYVATSETDSGDYGAVRHYDNAMTTYCKITKMVPKTLGELPAKEAYGVDIDPTNRAIWITDGPRDPDNTGTKEGGHVFTYEPCEGCSESGSTHARKGQDTLDPMEPN